MITNEKLKEKIQILLNKLKVGLNDEVISEAKLLLKKKKHQVLFNILSIAFQNKGEHDESIKIMTQALQIKPNNIFFLNNMGLSLFKKGELSEAEKYYARGLEIEPNYINILNNMANLKKDLEQTDKAISYYKKSMEINNNVLETHYNLASLYQSVGNFDESIKHYHKTLEINPKFTKADRNISLMTKYDANNKHFLQMKNKILNLKLEKNDFAELHFALGKAYEDIKDYKKAFENFKKANSFKKDLTKYKIKEDIDLFKKIKKFFEQKDFFSKKKNNRKIIFILGMPRSGTSLVEQIISSNGEVFGGGEVIYLNQIIRKHFLEVSDLEKLNYKNFSEKMNEAQEEYLSKISLVDNTEMNFTDKAPLNFRWIGFIMHMFPNSKIIHCKRNDIDVCWSNYKNNFDGGLYFSNNLKDIAIYYKLYQDLMNFWKNKFDKKIYDLNYENLVKNHESEIKKLIDFCEIKWDQNCLKHYENEKSIKTVSFAQARKPIYTSSIKNSDLYNGYLNELKSELKK